MTPMTLRLGKFDLEIVRSKMDYEEPRVIRRCNILHFLHLGYRSTEIATLLNIDPKTVTNVGGAYLESGIDAALFDDERSGRPIDIDDRVRSRIVAMVCTNPPKGADRWTLDLIVEEAQKRELFDRKISREQIRIILKQHNLKPWQEKMWCIEELSPEYIERMEDVLDVYARPYDEKKPVVCFDEKPVPLISEVREPILPTGPGEVLKKDYEYKRDGSANVFCLVEPKIGRYFNKVTWNRCNGDFAECMKDLASAYPEAEKIVLIMDNLSTHTENAVVSKFGEKEGKELWSRFEVHHTPVHGSWLNQAEIAIGMYSRQCLGDGRIGSFQNLINETQAWCERINEKKTKINWRFTKSKARKSLNYTPAIAA
jgi:transposase